MRTLAVIVGLLSLLLAACARDELQPPPKNVATSASDNAGAARPAPSPQDLVRLVGVVHNSGTHVCTEAGDDLWLNNHHEVGFVPIIADEQVTSTLAKQHLLPVVVHGIPSELGPTGPDKMPAAAVPCPPAQMRSDWEQGPDEMRMRRDSQSPFVAMKVSRVEPFLGLRVQRQQDTLVIDFENTLDVALEGPVEVILHYEGCYGKPGTHSITIDAQTGLAPGKVLHGTFPVIYSHTNEPSPARTRGGVAAYRAYSVQIRAEGENLKFDFDAAISAMGHPVGCPE